MWSLSCPSSLICISLAGLALHKNKIQFYQVYMMQGEMKKKTVEFELGVMWNYPGQSLEKALWAYQHEDQRSFLM